MRKEIKLTEELVPMNRQQLLDLDVYITLLSSMGDQNSHYVAKLGRRAMALSINDSVKIGAYKEVNNIRNAATAIAQYFGLVRMLLSHINEDVVSIKKKRDEYAKQYADRMVEVTKKRSEVEEEKEIAEKKYQRPVNRQANTE